MTFQFFPAMEDLPQGVVRWWEAMAGSPFVTPWWAATIVEAGLGGGDTVGIGLLRGEDGAPLALVPCRFHRARAKPASSRVLGSLTGIYSCLFKPVIDDASDRFRIAHLLGRSIGQSLAANDIIHFDALDAGWPALASFKAGLAESGFVASLYDHFGNWYEALAGRSYTDYLASRDGALREILRRKQIAAERAGGQFSIIGGGDELAAAWSVYDDVYKRSWKPAEPFPDFHGRLIQHGAPHGTIRIGILRLGDVPAAVQLWILWRGTATVLKLAHDERFANQSPGTLLTAYAIKRFIEQDHITNIDFGRGDDTYKRRWAAQRRQRIGLLAANPRSATGAMMLARQHAGHLLRAMKIRLPRRSIGSAML